MKFYVHTGEASWHQQRAGAISAGVMVYDKREDAEIYLASFKMHHPNEPAFIIERPAYADQTKGIS